MKIAIQSKGRLSEDSLNLLKKSGFSFQKTERSLTAKIENFPLEILFLRAGDIPEIVADGIADIGICGQNTVIESGEKINQILELGFGKCTLCLASPEYQSYDESIWKKDMRIATSYTKILQNYLDINNKKAHLFHLAGSVEIAPKLEISDMICDLVSTGSTLKVNGLKVRETIFESQAILIGNKNLSDENKTILEKILMRIQSVISAKNRKYIVMNAKKENIDKISACIPSLESPTVTALSDENMVSISSVIQENKFWETIDKLKENGASGILVMPIEKIIE